MFGEGKSRQAAVFTVVLTLLGGAWLGYVLTGRQSVPVMTQEKTEIQTPGELTLLAVGDVMLARGVNGLTKKYGDDYPFLKVRDQLREADITFGNLESPISDRGQALPGKQIAFRARLPMAEVLALSGFDVMSIANNHAVDYDSEALQDTLDLLWKHGVAAGGAGENIDEARQPVILEKDGIRIGFLSYTIFADTWFSAKYKRPFRATEERSGVAPLEEELVLSDLKELKPRVDLVVVSLHWGVEYQREPQPQQVELAHRLIDQGATLVIGHHPHIIQGVERYKNGLIAYSLGNFVFDQNNHDYTRQGLMLETKLNQKGLMTATLFPVYIDSSQPYRMDASEAAAVLDQVNELTRRLGTRCLVENDRLTIPFGSENKTRSH